MSNNHSLEEAPIQWLRNHSPSFEGAAITSTSVLQKPSEVNEVKKSVYKVNFYTNDHAGVLNNYTNQYLMSKLNKFHYETKINVAAITVPSLNGIEIENVKDILSFSNEDFKNVINEGILVIVVAEEGKAKIIVGPDVQAFLPWELRKNLDGQVSSFVDKKMAPHLLSGDFSLALRIGVDSIVEHVEPWIPKVRKIN
jgi:uncharacterized membrane protein YgcG